MLLKSPPFEVDPKDPFKNDVLNRKESAEVLTQLLSNISQPIVLSIDAQWGAGKTTFIDMWSQHLKNEDFTVLSFNAWKNDFCKDPLVALIAEFDDGISKLELKGDSKGKVENTIQKVKRVGQILLKNYVSTTVKLASNGIVDCGAINEAWNSEKAKPMEDEFQGYIEYKQSIENFKLYLGELVSEISESNGAELERPLVFIVDELDRCRPLFAIELLETAKHIFDVEGIVFVLAIDKEQLGHSIRSVYGQGMDVDGYLRRFVDVDFWLPKAKTSAFVHKQLKTYGIVSYFQNSNHYNSSFYKQQLEKCLGSIFSIFGCSLRTQEQCLTQLSLFLCASSSDHDLCVELIVFLIVLRAIQSEQYTEYLNGGSHKPILELICNNPSGIDFINSNEGAILEGHLIAFCKDKSIAEQEHARFNSIVNEKGLDGNQKRRAQIISHIISDYYTSYDNLLLKDIVGKIELSSQLVHSMG